MAPRLAAAADQKKETKAYIVLWMGGPSRMDSWDLMNDTKNGGPDTGTATAVPGLQLSGHLPTLVAGIKDLGIIRSRTTKEGEHGRATQLSHTG